MRPNPWAFLEDWPTDMLRALRTGMFRDPRSSIHLRNILERRNA